MAYSVLLRKETAWKMGKQTDSRIITTEKQEIWRSRLLFDPDADQSRVFQRISASHGEMQLPFLYVCRERNIRQC